MYIKSITTAQTNIMSSCMIRHWKTFPMIAIGQSSWVGLHVPHKRTLLLMRTADCIVWCSDSEHARALSKSCCSHLGLLHGIHLCFHFLSALGEWVGQGCDKGSTIKQHQEGSTHQPALQHSDNAVICTCWLLNCQRKQACECGRMNSGIHFKTILAHWCCNEGRWGEKEASCAAKGQCQDATARAGHVLLCSDFGRSDQKNSIAQSKKSFRMQHCTKSSPRSSFTHEPTPSLQNLVDAF